MNTQFPGQVPSEDLAGTGASPYDLGQVAAYEAWRAFKIDSYPADSKEIIVNIKNPFALMAEEKAALLANIRRCNMAIYQLEDTNQQDKALITAIGEQLGLSRLDNNLRADEDSVTSLEVKAQAGNQYIPYTNRPLSWHADGYYNALTEQVRAVILHCVTPAFEGGMNGLLDHELLYIRLRDENPEWIRALMHPAAMTIPPNIEEGTQLRAERVGPVFSVNEADGSLHMRYSARKKNIAWREDALTNQAVARISELLNDEPMIIRHILQSGQGLISNNVLHNRTAFEDSDPCKRLMYRARYYDRIANT